MPAFLPPALRVLLLSGCLLAGSGPLATAGAPPDEAGAGRAALEGLSIRRDARARETYYEPAYDTWTLYDLRFYPILRVGADGTKTLLLRVSTQSDRRIGIRSLDIEIDGEARSVPLKRPEVKADTTGCRVIETALLEGQEDLIRSIAAAREVFVSVAGVRGTTRYPLSDRERADFSRVLALFGAGSLSMPESPDRSEDPQAKKGLTNPRIVRKVNPEFPDMAKEKMARGKVTLHAVVRKDGSAEVIEVMKSSARYCGFEQAAIDAVRQWRYEPGMRDGAPVDVYFTVDLDFTWR